MVWLYSRSYRLLQRALHRVNLHYMPPIRIESETLLWCHWCGARGQV
jgi:hypothetical protein